MSDPINEHWEHNFSLETTISITLVDIFFEDIIWGYENYTSIDAFEWIEMNGNDFFTLLLGYINILDGAFLVKNSINILKADTKRFIIENEVTDLNNINSTILTLFKLQVLK